MVFGVDWPFFWGGFVGFDMMKFMKMNEKRGAEANTIICACAREERNSTLSLFVSLCSNSLVKWRFVAKFHQGVALHFSFLFCLRIGSLIAVEFCHIFVFTLLLLDAFFLMEFGDWIFLFVDNLALY